MNDDLVNKVADMVQEAMVKHDCGIRSLHVPSVAREIIAMVKADGWIAVSERLPEDAKNVLTATVRENGLRTVTRIGFYRDNEWKTLILGGDNEVTHWMPLPNPPNYNPR